MDDFRVGRFSFENVERVALNGTEGRFWEVRELTGGAWVFRGRIFCPLSYSQDDIVEDFFSED